MKSPETSFNFAETYFSLLKSLSRESKLKLISWLTKSVNTPKKGGNNNINTLFGAFESEKTADEQIKELKNLRTFTRKTEEL